MSKLSNNAVISKSINILEVARAQPLLGKLNCDYREALRLPGGIG